MHPPPDLSGASDREVVRSARRGDEPAFRELWRRYRRRVRGWVYRMVHHRERAEDLTQETFARAFATLDRYRSERTFAPWILGIANNAATDYVRRKRPERATAPWAVSPDCIDLAGIGSPHPSDLPGPEPYADAAAAFRRAWRRLNPKYRRCVRLRHTERLSYAEIAAKMGVSVGTVGTYLSRARSDLERMMNERSGRRTGGRAVRRSVPPSA